MIVEKDDARKGFVATLDLIIAIFVVFVLITIAITLLNAHNSDKDYLYLQTLGQDTLTTLQKSNTLTNTVKDKTSKDLRIFVNNLPANVCGTIILYNESGTVIYTERKDCFAKSDKRNIYRSFVYGTSMYYARAILWYR